MVRFSHGKDLGKDGLLGLGARRNSGRTPP